MQWLLRCYEDVWNITDVYEVEMLQSCVKHFKHTVITKLSITRLWDFLNRGTLQCLWGGDVTILCEAFQTCNDYEVEVLQACVKYKEEQCDVYKTGVVQGCVTIYKQQYNVHEVEVLQHCL